MLVCLTWAAMAVAAEPEDGGKAVSAGRVAVFEIEVDGVKFAPKTLQNLTSLLTSCVTAGGKYTAVASNRIEEALVEVKVKSHQDACDKICQIKIGQKLSADKVIHSLFWKVGGNCSLSLDLYDLGSEIMERSVVVPGVACNEAGLYKAVIEGVDQLSGGQAKVGSGAVPSSGGKTVSPGLNGGFQVTDLPAVPEVKAVRDIGAEGGVGGIDNVDLDALEAYDRVVAIDGGRSTSTADKIRAWEDLGRRFPSYADKAESRVAEWRQYEIQRAEAKRIELLRREAMEADWGKLSRLLKLKVVSDAQKKEWATAFNKAYGSDFANNPHYGDLLPYTVSIPAGWALIPAGSFQMGSPPTESVRGGDEGAQTRVTISAPFMLKMTEVTQGEWKAVMGSNPSFFGSCGDTCPVESVSWDDAVEYCNRLSKEENLEQCYDKSGDSHMFRGVACKGYRLPTEAEWEYAARAGSTADRYGEINQIAWYDKNSSTMTHPVGQKLANALGLWDMLGNVWEWCSDLYADNLPSGSVTDPAGSSTGSSRALRGGSWSRDAGYVRAAGRTGLASGYRGAYIGFRPARSVR